MKFFSATSATILALTTIVTAQTTNGLSAAEVEGRALAQKLLEQWPAENSTNHGLVKIKHRDDISIVFETLVTETNWISRYQTGASWLTIIRSGTNANQYHFHAENGKETDLSGSETMQPFAGSDFWVTDLGLEFFHWPGQKVLPNPTTLKLGRSYTLLESTSPFTNGYSRVLTWIDRESYGILEAEAYDVKGELLKEFYPKNFKKVNGLYQVESMDMINHQTDSRTRLEFDLKK